MHWYWSIGASSITLWDPPFPPYNCPKTSTNKKYEKRFPREIGTLEVLPKVTLGAQKVFQSSEPGHGGGGSLPHFVRFEGTDAIY